MIQGTNASKDCMQKDITRSNDQTQGDSDSRVQLLQVSSNTITEPLGLTLLLLLLFLRLLFVLLLIFLSMLSGLLSADLEAVLPFPVLTLTVLLGPVFQVVGEGITAR